MQNCFAFEMYKRGTLVCAGFISGYQARSATATTENSRRTQYTSRKLALNFYIFSLFFSSYMYAFLQVYDNFFHLHVTY